jgi:hypothetical protein
MAPHFQQSAFSSVENFELLQHAAQAGASCRDSTDAPQIAQAWG